MKKIHAALIGAAALILILSLSYGLLTLYSEQRTIPKGTLLADWDIGGMDQEKVRQQLEEQITAMHSLPLVLKVEGSTELKLTLKEAGVAYEAEAFLKGLQKLATGNLLDRVKARRSFSPHWSLNVHLDLKGLQQKLSSAWEEETFGLPVDATRRITKDDRVLYTPETSSRKVDWTALESALLAALPKSFSDAEVVSPTGITIQLPLAVLKPKVTLQILKEEGIDRKISEFSTSLGASGPGRSHNVDAAAKAVNETVLPPGGIFDYGKAIEKAKAEYGFREAPVIVNGKLQPGVGGGICQVSSTLYNAALHSGLEIVERHNHSIPVSYLPKGQDATFAEGSINFRFRNNTGKYMIIKAAVHNRTLTVKMFGTFPRNVRYVIESKTVDILVPPDQVVNDSSLSPGSSRVIQRGKAGYVVETYMTRMVDGKSVEKKKISRDVYRAQKRIIALPRAGTGTTKPQSTQRPLIEDGVRSE